MHEMSLAMNIVDQACAAAAKEKARVVNSVEIAVGSLAGVMPEALSFCFTAAASGTIAEQAGLVIRHIPARGECESCGTEFDVKSYFDECPECRHEGTTIKDGLDLRIISITIDE